MDRIRRRFPIGLKVARAQMQWRFRNGYADIAIGLWSEVGDWAAGQVRVLSGALFTDPLFVSPPIDIDSEKALEFTLWIVDGKSGETIHLGTESLGQGLNALGDVNGDNIPDLGVGTGVLDDAIVLSSADGTRLHEWTSDDLNLFQLVVETAGIGDVNGDGFRDVVVGRKGSVRLMSGGDGTLLAEVLESERCGDLGEEIAAIGDLFGDGISEVLAGGPGRDYALVISFAPIVQLEITLEDGHPVISWPAGLTVGLLESSQNLLNWEPVVEIDEVGESRYPISIGADGRACCRFPLTGNVVVQ
ncbi:MAG: hypothetical protein ACI9R3_003454 [Verrucomicrobiales bacterium]|jgi:hypothetical protein